jgi:hypothetical protein
MLEWEFIAAVRGLMSEPLSDGSFPVLITVCLEHVCFAPQFVAEFRRAQAERPDDLSLWFVADALIKIAPIVFSRGLGDGIAGALENIPSNRCQVVTDIIDSWRLYIPQENHSLLKGRCEILLGNSGLHSIGARSRSAFELAAARADFDDLRSAWDFLDAEITDQSSSTVQPVAASRTAATKETKTELNVDHEDEYMPFVVDGAQRLALATTEPRAKRKRVQVDDVW